SCAPHGHSSPPTLPRNRHRVSTKEPARLRPGHGVGTAVAHSLWRTPSLLQPDEGPPLGSQEHLPPASARGAERISLFDTATRARGREATGPRPRRSSPPRPMNTL